MGLNSLDVFGVGVTIKDQNDASRHRRPAALDIHAAAAANTQSRSSLVSVADHVEHLTDTALGQSLSFYRLFIIVSLAVTSQTYESTD